MDIVQLSSFTASVVSVVLAIVAIVMTFRFYGLSSAAERRAAESAAAIHTSVKVLNSLFDKMVSETFSMLRSLQEKVFIDPRSREPATGEAVAVEPTGDTTSPTSTTAMPRGSEEPKSLLQKKISMHILCTKILAAVRIASPTVHQLHLFLATDAPRLHANDVINALFALRHEGKVHWDGAPGALSTGEVIYLADDEDPDATSSDTQ